MVMFLACAGSMEAARDDGARQSRRMRAGLTERRRVIAASERLSWDDEGVECIGSWGRSVAGCVDNALLRRPGARGLCSVAVQTHTALPNSPHLPFLQSLIIYEMG